MFGIFTDSQIVIYFFEMKKKSIIDWIEIFELIGNDVFFR